MAACADSDFLFVDVDCHWLGSWGSILAVCGLPLCTTEMLRDGKDQCSVNAYILTIL